MSGLAWSGDVLVIGAGFSGSFTAMLLARAGLRPLVVERGTHPRFAIGESSTPLANLVWEQLCARFDLPRLAPLAGYGPWRKAYPDLPVGLKRGFVYFEQRPGQAFRPQHDHSGELLVAASAAEADADTHWLRADFDHFLIQELLSLEIPYLDRTEIKALRQGPTWEAEAVRDGHSVTLRARFVLDASGDGGVLSRFLGIDREPRTLATNSRSVFAHFRGVGKMHDWLAARGGRVEDHPFPCDDSALHHVLPDGWVWVLPFRHGVTSVGVVWDNSVRPRSGASASEEWAWLLATYPTLADTLAGTEIVAPGTGLVQTGRLQRRAKQASGKGWAMMANTACFFDPLHSTGNAHTLFGIERLVDLLTQEWDRPEMGQRLIEYDRAMSAEIDLLDMIIHGSYKAMAHFEIFSAFSMCYFAAATTSEHARRTTSDAGHLMFLRAGEPEFMGFVREVYAELLSLVERNPTPAEIDAFTQHVAAGLEPWNIAGLCDPSRQGMYPFAGAVP